VSNFAQRPGISTKHFLFEMEIFFQCWTVVRKERHVPTTVINPSISSLPCQFSKLQRTGFGIIIHGSQTYETVEEPVINPRISSLPCQFSKIQKTGLGIIHHGSQKYGTVKTGYQPESILAHCQFSKFPNIRLSARVYPCSLPVLKFSKYPVISPSLSLLTSGSQNFQRTGSGI
jgi:hypothetical protein